MEVLARLESSGKEGPRGASVMMAFRAFSVVRGVSILYSEHLQ